MSAVVVVQRNEHPSICELDDRRFSTLASHEVQNSQAVTPGCLK